MADKALEKKIIDGVGLVESTAEGFAVIDSLTRKANDLQAKLDEATGAAAAAQTAHETALAAKDTEIADLKSKAPAGAALDALVNARAQLVSDAKRIGGAELVTDGKTDLEIQKDAVTAHMGDAEKVKGWNDSQFTGAFSYLATQVSDDGGDAGAREERQEPSGLRDALRPQPQATNDGKADSYESKMSARWSSKKKAAA